LNAWTIISEVIERGIILSLNGGNLALKGAAKPPDDLLARIKAHKNNIVAILKQEAAVVSPPNPDKAEIEERKGLASDSVPEPYLDAWARLQRQNPAHIEEPHMGQARKFMIAAQSDRAVRQPAQAVPPRRNPLRKNRQGLSFNAMHCSDKALDKNCQHSLSTAREAVSIFVAAAWVALFLFRC